MTWQNESKSKTTNSLVFLYIFDILCDLRFVFIYSSQYRNIFMKYWKQLTAILSYLTLHNQCHNKEKTNNTQRKSVLFLKHLFHLLAHATKSSKRFEGSFAETHKTPFMLFNYCFCLSWERNKLISRKIIILRKLCKKSKWNHLVTNEN